MNFKTFCSDSFRSVLLFGCLVVWVLLAMQIPVSRVNADDPEFPEGICQTTPTPSSTLVPLPTCTTTPTPYRLGENAIPIAYQPRAPYTAELAWIVFTPTPAPSASPPGIVVIHGGGWHAGNVSEGTGVCQDLATKGYYVVSVAYELARCGYIQGQNTDDHDYNGDLPDDMVTRQTNDIKAFVVALRNSGLVNPNKIGVVGGSAGATHAVWVALDTTDTGSNWPFWNAAARPQCAVMLSAAYDFSDRTPPNGQTEIGQDFVLWTENYVNTADLATLKAKSPVSLVAAPTQQAPFVPLYLINSWFDPVAPWHQMVDMVCALRSVGVQDSAYQTLTVPDSNAHSFHLWSIDDGISNPPQPVKKDVIDFLDAHLKSP